MLIYFAAFKNHYSIFVEPVFLQLFKKELKKYETTKPAVHFQFNKPLPIILITKIVKYVAKQKLKKATLKNKKDS